MKRSNRLLKRLVKLGATVALLLACSGLKTSAQVNTIVRIDGLGGSTVNLTGLNGAGNVVGYADTAGDASQHPLLYQAGATLDLGTFGGANGYARGLNDLAQVVGTASVTGDAGSHAFLFSQGTLRIQCANCGTAKCFA